MKLLTPDIGIIFWTLIVFSTLFFLLKKLAWRPILQALKERETGIAAALAEAQKMKAAMALMKSENESFWTLARQEREQMIREAKEIAIRLQWEAKDKARRECRQLLEDAFNAIEQEKRAVLAQAKLQVNGLAVEVSEKVLHRQLTDKSAIVVYLNEWPPIKI